MTKGQELQQNRVSGQNSKSAVDPNYRTSAFNYTLIWKQKNQSFNAVSKRAEQNVPKLLKDIPAQFNLPRCFTSWKPKIYIISYNIFLHFSSLTQIAPNSRILLSRVLNGNGRFCSSYEVSPSSFRYYSSSVEYLSGILTKNKLACILLTKSWLFSFLRNIFLCIECCL